MDSKYKYDEKKEILRLATFIGELMLINGAETYRVEDSVKRVCKSRGYNYISVFIAPTVIILSDDRFDGYSFMKIINKRGINLNNISKLNSFCRKFVEDVELSVLDALEELKYINNEEPYPQWVTHAFVAIGSASFAVLIGGDNITTFILTIIASVIITLSYNKMMEISNIPAFSSLIASMLIALLGVLLTNVGIIQTPKMLIVGSIMPLLPGMSFIQAIRDLISGDLISGVARAFDALITAFAIASGVGLILNIYIKSGGIL